MSNPSDVWPHGMPEVGQSAQRSRTVRATDIERFTEISGDRNPLHYDGEAARASRFGEIVVQDHRARYARDPGRWDRGAGTRRSLLHHAAAVKADG